MKNSISIMLTLVMLLTAVPALGEADGQSCVPETPGAMSKEELIKTLGVVTKDDVTYITDYISAREGDRLDLRLILEDGVYYGGTDGYMEQWMVGKGIISDLKYDLDGDGEDELVLIYCGEDEIRRHYPHIQGYILIYEPQNDKYVRTAVIPIDIITDGTSERGVRLLEHDGHRQLVLIRNARWDGNCGSITAEAYEYDGQEAHLMLIAGAFVGCPSFVATGPFDIAWRDQLDEISLFYGELEAEEDLGLRKGENYFAYEDYVHTFDGENEKDGINYINPKAFEGFDAVADRLKKYGYELSRKTSIYHSRWGEVWEQYELLEADRGKTLLWLKEGFEGEYQTYVDVTVTTSLDHGE